MGEIAKSEQANEGSAFLEAITEAKPKLSNVVAAASAVVAGGKKEAVLSLGRIVQATIHGRAQQQLYDEFESYKRTGKIKDDYEETDQFWDCLHAALKAIENATDSEQLNAIRAVFLGIATENVTERDNVLAYQLLRTVAGLSAMEVIMLRGAKKLEKANRSPSMDNPSQISANLLQDCGVSEHFQFLADDALDSLCAKRLVCGISALQLAEAIYANKVLLTNYGRSLCSLIEQGTEENAPSS